MVSGETQVKTDARSAGSRGEPLVAVRQLVKQFRRRGGDLVRAVDEVSMEVREGEMVVLLGPSGCGKTTLLRSIVGLETPDSGKIHANGRVVFDTQPAVDIPPEGRGVSMMFQNYALWPHLTVGQNVNYPLRARKYPKSQCRDKVMQSLAAVGLEALFDQYPGEMSGGQQQRIALARSLVTDPRVIVFDEPLSNVDARVRHDLRVEILAVQRMIGFAGIYVTHDQQEAMQMATRLAIMKDGVIVQMGAPEDVYRNPVNRFVATFVGTSNMLDVRSNQRVDAQQYSVETSLGPIRVELGHEVDATSASSWRHVAVRPESILIGRERTEALTVSARVETVMFSGAGTELTLLVGGERLNALAPPRQTDLRPDDDVYIGFDAAAVRPLAG
jgi:iron(III) transport system ATP-binding protein